MENQKIDLNPQQIHMAATAGLQLLNTQGAVKVDGPMAVSGAVRVLYSLLSAIVSQEVMIVNVPVKLADAPPPAEPNKEVAGAVAAAVKNNGEGAILPIAPVESQLTPDAVNEAETGKGPARRK